MQIIKSTQNIKIPTYMNEEFFIQTLEDGLREVKIKLNDVNFEWGSNPGDNYCSQIYRVRINFERFTLDGSMGEEQISLIVKTIPVIPETQFLEDVGVFIKEKLTYTDLIPRMEILLDNGEKFSATCYYATKTPMKTIIFSDLAVNGFKCASRQDCLDWDHAALLLKQLAKFHATSMVVMKRDPNIVKRFKSGMLSEETILRTATFKQMFGGCLAYLAEVAAQWSGYENIANKLKKLYDNFEEITSNLASPKSNDRFIVINHGDLWTSNFMYAYDAENSKKPKNVLFVDFQLSFYGSPGCDLNFFLNTSVQLDVLQQHRDDLIMVYYKTLTQTLEFLRYKEIPTLDDLKFELRNRELYGLFALYGFFPMVTLPKELSGDSSIESLSNTDAQRNKFDRVFRQEKLIKFLKYGLKRFDDLGVLDEY